MLWTRQAVAGIMDWQAASSATAGRVVERFTAAREHVSGRTYHPRADMVTNIGSAASNHPFDAWFLEQARHIHGADLAQPLPGPPPQLVFEA